MGDEADRQVDAMADGSYDPECEGLKDESYETLRRAFVRRGEALRVLRGQRDERRRLIREGWNVEFDRESGQELWILDDPPLEESK